MKFTDLNFQPHLNYPDTGIDTKNKSARSKFRGAKIVTESI